MYVVTLVAATVLTSLPNTVEVYNDTYHITAPDQRTAERTLAWAMEDRDRIAETWLEKKLPEGVGNARITAYRDDRQLTGGGLTYIGGPHESTRVVLSIRDFNSPNYRNLVAHEMLHVIIGSKYRRFPRWIHEGIASRYDCKQMQYNYQCQLYDWYFKDTWPKISLLNDGFHDNSVPAYTMSHYMVEYLVQLKDKSTVVKFGADCELLGMEAALRKHYSFESVEKFYLSWRMWIVDKIEQ